MSSVVGITVVAGAVVVGGVVLKKVLASALSNNRGAVLESDGEEVFRGPPAEATKVIHQLADAGVIAWSEQQEQGEVAVLVDTEQAGDVPTLLRVQQHMKKEKATEASTSSSSSGTDNAGDNAGDKAAAHAAKASS